MPFISVAVTLDPGTAHPKFDPSKAEEKEASESQEENKRPLATKHHHYDGLRAAPAAHLAPVSCGVKEEPAHADSCRSHKVTGAAMGLQRYVPQRWAQGENSRSCPAPSPPFDPSVGNASPAISEAGLGPVSQGSGNWRPTASGSTEAPLKRYKCL